MTKEPEIITEATGKKTKISPTAIISLLVIIVAIIFWSYYSSTNDISDFAKKELNSKTFTIIELNVLEANMAGKNKKATGKVAFIVKNKHGVTFKGIADIDNKTEWFIVNEQIFNLVELKQQ